MFRLILLPFLDLLACCLFRSDEVSFAVEFEKAEAGGALFGHDLADGVAVFHGVVLACVDELEVLFVALAALFVAKSCAFREGGWRTRCGFA